MSKKPITDKIILTEAEYDWFVEWADSNAVDPVVYESLQKLFRIAAQADAEIDLTRDTPGERVDPDSYNGRKGNDFDIL